MIKRGFLTNLLMLFVLFAVCAALLGRLIVQRDNEIEASETWIAHSYPVINEIESIPALLESMLSSQRGYILTDESAFIAEYKGYRTAFYASIDRLIALTSNNLEQTARFEKMKKDFKQFAARLESRAEKYKSSFFLLRKDFSSTTKAISYHKQLILNENKKAMEYEKIALQGRINMLEHKKKQYYEILFIGGIGIPLVLFIFNALILYNYSRRTTAEKLLKESEERFTLAADSTNDGIFDWDLRRGKVYYTRQFFTMLGHNRPAMLGAIADFMSLVHAEDVERVRQHLEGYLGKEFAEFTPTFRMRHATGGAVWVQSRAKAVFDVQGKAIRMVGVNSDITFMKEYQEYLKQEKRSAEEANRAKSEFLAHMSHEIRTPLTAISGIAEIFQRRQDNLDARQKQLIKTLFSSAGTLCDLISDVLDFSKIESDEMKLAESAFLLSKVFEQIIDIMSINAKEKGLAFAFDYEDVRDMSFYGDALRIRQILINLISNAVKFTKEGGVTVKATHHRRDGHGVLEISVRDTGIGIPKEEHEFIFERFKQIDSSVSRRYQGTGLGLSISRNLAKLMGGTIRLQSAPGKGATFTLLLPVQQVSLAPKEPAEMKTTVIRQAAGPQGDNRVLIVDDYEGNVIVLSYILDELGYTHDIAHNGKECLMLWEKNRYDLILMDVQMPEMDGFTATSTIRATEREKSLPHTPIIGMTAHALVGDKNRCIESGMDFYLPKPIVGADLKEAIFSALKKNGETKAS